jgi:3'(2'), 5'-bisphosphate nucleotidase
MNDLLELLLPIARDAGAEVMDVYSKPFDVHFKRPEDPVTEADRRANSLICERLASICPGTVVVAEESPEADWADYREHERVFFVDPLDGTREFVARNDMFVVMIGLLEGDEPTHGVLYAPVTGVAWIGARGQGAFEVAPSGERRQLSLTEAASLGAARVVSSRSHRTSLLERALSALDAAEVIPIGSAGLKGAAVARGAADVYLAPESAGCRWDACAPEAIVRAAGGVYTDSRGRRLDYRASSLENDRGIVAAAPRTHAAVLERLAPLFDVR